jgi:hypothetical protein
MYFTLFGRNKKCSTKESTDNPLKDYSIYNDKKGLNVLTRNLIVFYIYFRNLWLSKL